MSSNPKTRLFILATIVAGYDWSKRHDAANRRGGLQLMRMPPAEYFAEIADQPMFPALPALLRELGFEPTGGETIKFDEAEVWQVYWGARKAALQVRGATPELPGLTEAQRLQLNSAYEAEFLQLLQSRRYSLASKILLATDPDRRSLLQVPTSVAT